MAVRYSRPRLITSDDRLYRQHVEHYTIQRQNNRAMRPPRQRDLFGGQAERALRDWLAAQLPLAETRILGYEEVRGRRSSTRYRELDAVLIEDRRTIRIFETKASRTASSLRKAVQQLRETRAILGQLYARVHTTIMLVDTGIPTAEERAALMASEDAPRTPPETLPDVLAALSDMRRISRLDEQSTDGSSFDLLVFSVDDIIALAGAENLALDWEADDAFDLEAYTAPPPSLVYSTDEADERDAGDERSASTPPDDSSADDNPLAAALRRAGLSNATGDTSDTGQAGQQ